VKVSILQGPILFRYLDKIDNFNYSRHVLNLISCRKKKYDICLVYKCDVTYEFVGWILRSHEDPFRLGASRAGVDRGVALVVSANKHVVGLGRGPGTTFKKSIMLNTVNKIEGSYLLKT
jgi:hypothetical protein